MKYISLFFFFNLFVCVFFLTLRYCTCVQNLTELSYKTMNFMFL